MYEIDKEKLGFFISEHRKEKGYTQKELAAQLFISDKAVSKWETGISIPDAALWIPLAKLLGVTVTELLMCQCVEPTAPMSSDEVETLVKKAISFSEDNPVQKKQRKKHFGLLFLISIVISCVGHFFIRFDVQSLLSLLLSDIMGGIFGIYFIFFAQEKLPTYFDENKISSYSDGFFRMNVPGLSFNNSNWPHIINVGRIWSMAVIAICPALQAVCAYLFPGIWASAGLYFIMAVVILGLLIPFYIVGKKYE